MKKGKRLVLLLSIFVGIVAIILISIFIFPSLIMFLSAQFTWFRSPEPLKPEITRAQFNISLQYEQDGVIEEAKDIMICEFDGIGMDQSYQKCREWVAELSSGEEGLVLWKGKNKLGKEEILWYVYDDNPGYYMGDPNYTKDSDYEGEIDKNVFCVERGIKNSNGSWQEADFIDESDVLFEKYGIKLKSYRCDPPIKNNFK